MAVDLRIAKPGQLGNLLQHFTGSGRHNAALREAAVRQRPARLRVRDPRRRNRRHATRCATEEEVYELLGLAYIEPELRENRGELEAARTTGDAAAADRAGGHPRRPAQPHDRLRRPQHDRGDGARRARARLRVPRDHRPLGLATASATTSRPSSCAARSSSCARPTRAIEGIELLAGSEVNILPDGSLDYEDELLGELDWVIASVHTAFGTGEQRDDRAGDRRDRAPARATPSATPPAA